VDRAHEWPRAHLPAQPRVDEEELALSVRVLRSRRTVLLLGGSLTQEHLTLAHRVAQATSSRVVMRRFRPSSERGAGIPEPEPSQLPERVRLDQLKDVETVILIGAREPAGLLRLPQRPEPTPSRTPPKMIDLVAPAVTWARPSTH